MLKEGARSEHQVDVRHVKAHQAKKGKVPLTMFEKFVTERNESEDLLAKEEADLYSGELQRSDEKGWMCTRHHGGLRPVIATQAKTKRGSGPFETAEQEMVSMELNVVFKHELQVHEEYHVNQENEMTWVTRSG